jgi:competence protein ComEC
LVCVLGLGLLAWGSAGWRALDRQADILTPPLEGITVHITVEVDDVPRATPGGWRFSARPLGHAVVAATGLPAPLPERLLLGWYASADSAAPRAGERWQLAVRLRQPHGLANPNGFDQMSRASPSL